jgi:hypothetical protein
MGRKEDRKKQKKRERERAKHRRSAAHQAKKQSEAAGGGQPRILVDPTGGDIVFVRRVQEAAKTVSLEESGGCPADVVETIRRVRRDGPIEAFTQFRIEAAQRHDYQQELLNEVQSRFRTALAYVGERIFEQLPELYQQHLLPNYCFSPCFVPEGVSIAFNFIPRVKRDTGWGYYSPNEPKVTINGAQWIVCFSEHAIERIVERSCFSQQLTFAHYWDCFAYLEGCVYYEPVTLDGDRPGIRLLMTENLGGPPDRYREYLRKVAGIDDVLKYPVIPSYVLGYCHVDCRGKFAKAISMWSPGYRGTPEDRLVRTANITTAERQRLLAMADDNKTVRVINEGRHEAIKWYHDNGVPQVDFPNRRLFEWHQT